MGVHVPCRCALVRFRHDALLITLNKLQVQFKFYLNTLEISVLSTPIRQQFPSIFIALKVFISVKRISAKHAWIPQALFVLLVFYAFI